MDDKAFREAFVSEIAEYAKEAEANDLVELYNKFSANEVEMNENDFTIKTPETAEIIADAEQEVADAEAEVIADAEVTEKVKDFVDYDRNKEEPHTPEKDGEEEAEDKSDELDTDGRGGHVGPRVRRRTRTGCSGRGQVHERPRSSRKKYTKKFFIF